jgi:hypothetical protein
MLASFTFGWREKKSLLPVFLQERLKLLVGIAPMRLTLWVRVDQLVYPNFEAFLRNLYIGCVYFLKKSTVQTKDSPSHQTCNTCMEY